MFRHFLTFSFHDSIIILYDPASVKRPEKRKTEDIFSMLEALKKEVLQANLVLKEWGLVRLTWGNASGIDRERGLVVIKPSGVAYETMTAEDMVVMDLDGNIVEGTLKPSSDAPTHLELYRHFPGIGGVVHTHSVYATAFAQARREIPAMGTTHADHFYGSIPCTDDMRAEEIQKDYEKNTGTVIVRCFASLDPMQIPAVLVASHGVFTWGKNAKTAAENALVTEETAKMAYLSQNLSWNTALSKELLDRHYFRKHGAGATYGQGTPEKCESRCQPDFSELIGTRKCACGKTHQCDVKTIVMRPGALSDLPKVIAGLGTCQHVAMICDRNTYEAAGRRVETLISFDTSVILDPENLHANEFSTAEAEKKLPRNTDLLVAVGSGTVHDITRFVAHARGIPFVSVPTAASVDGYVSSVAAMTWRGAKKTMNACAPVAMVADIEIIAKAPKRLTASGVGDMLGKYSALVDWRISHLLTGEYLCEKIVSLVREALCKVSESVERLSCGDYNAYTSLMHGLVLSGIAMQLAGCSRPASGAEHHISHFIEMTVPTQECNALHGEKVGVGEVIVTELYHRFAALPEKQAFSLLAGYHMAGQTFIGERFGRLCGEVETENRSDCAKGIQPERIRECLSQIRNLILQEMPSEQEIVRLLSIAGAPSALTDIGLTEDKRRYLIESAPWVRNRLTLMRLIAGSSDFAKIEKIEY